MRELFVSTVGAQILARRQVVPVIHLRGSHYDVGFDTGRIFGAVIKDFVANSDNLRSFEKEYKTDVGQKAYDKTLANMKKRFPYYIKEIQGVADGANVSFHQLFLLQMDDIIETINDNHVIRDDKGGCSSIGVNQPKEAILGHTEDAFSETLNRFYIMSAHIIPTKEDMEQGAEEERFSSLCYAGHLPGYTMGFNQHGMVFSINTLSPEVLKPGNTPRTFITRKLLTAKNFSDAERILLDKGLGIGNGFDVNMLWTDGAAHRDLYNVEVAPDLQNDKSMLSVHKYEKEPLIHCNSYLRLKVKEVIGPIIDSSAERLQAIRRHPTPTTRAEVADILSDQTGKLPFTVFQDRNDTVIRTIAAGIFDLNKMTWSIYIDKPKISEPVAVLPITFPKINQASQQH